LPANKSKRNQSKTDRIKLKTGNQENWRDICHPTDSRTIQWIFYDSRKEIG